MAAVFYLPPGVSSFLRTLFPFPPTPSLHPGSLNRLPGNPYRQGKEDVAWSPGVQAQPAPAVGCPKSKGSGGKEVQVGETCPPRLSPGLLSHTGGEAQTRIAIRSKYSAGLGGLSTE